MKLSSRWAAICCVSMCYALTGCQGGNEGFKSADELKKERPAVVNKEGADHDHDHGHHHHAPHHGSLTMLGDHVAQIELVVDADAGKLDAYILDGEAEKPLVVDDKDLSLSVKLPEGKEPLELKLAPADAAKPEEGFTVQNDQLKGVKSLEGTIASLKIGDKTHEKIAVSYDSKKAAEEAEEAHKHGHEDHDHDKHGEDKDHDHPKDKDHDGEKKADETPKAEEPKS